MFCAQVRGRKQVGVTRIKRNTIMQWTRPAISETETGMEVTSYMPAELDRA